MVTGRPADWCQPFCLTPLFVNDYHTIRVADRFSPVSPLGLKGGVNKVGRRKRP